MTKVLILNGHRKYPFSPGRLNASFVERAEAYFKGRGYEVRKTVTEEDYDVASEIEKFKWADVVMLQTPLNWMDVPWTFKKYIDDVWTAGMMGETSAGDGRSSEHPKKNYGTGGLLKGRYMLSVTANAPQEAFNDEREPYFAGRSEDDLLLPLHLNFKWLGLEKIPSFWAYDVMKNAQVDTDFARFDAHLAAHL